MSLPAGFDLCFITPLLIVYDPLKNFINKPLFSAVLVVRRLCVKRTFFLKHSLWFVCEFLYEDLCLFVFFLGFRILVRDGTLLGSVRCVCLSACIFFFWIYWTDTVENECTYVLPWPKHGRLTSNISKNHRYKKYLFLVEDVRSNS